MKYIALETVDVKLGNKIGIVKLRKGKIVSLPPTTAKTLIARRFITKYIGDSKSITAIKETEFIDNGNIGGFIIPNIVQDDTVIEKEDMSIDTSEKAKYINEIMDAIVGAKTKKKIKEILSRMDKDEVGKAIDDSVKDGVRDFAKTKMESLSKNTRSKRKRARQ